jgi:hypothetical protein
MYSTSLIIKDIQIKTMVRYHLTPVRMLIIRNTKVSMCGWECGEKGALAHCCWGCKLVQSHYWKQYGNSSKKLKVKLLFFFSSFIPGLYPKEMKLVYWRDICTVMFLRRTWFVIAKKWNQHKCPLTEWVKKCDVCVWVYEYYSAIKVWNPVICDNMNRIELK